ncbi:MAG: hypothetical protein COA99_19050 [Moraxellaceae bacterium]|nr:MAG: hypothetical protein COA99_19050 [Moraxellaceae bacterium]
MEHKGKVTKQIFIGFVSIVFLVLSLWFIFPSPDSPDRITYTLTWSALFALPLFFGIHITLFTRFASEDLILGYASSKQLTFNKAYLSNTVEQTIINVLSALTLGMVAPIVFIKLVPIQACIFSVGRLIYYFTYKSKPTNRFVGFVIGYYIAVLSVATSVYWVITGNV